MKITDEMVEVAAAKLRSMNGGSKANSERVAHGVLEAVLAKRTAVELSQYEIFTLAGQLQRQWEYLEEVDAEPDEAAHLKKRARELFAIGENFVIGEDA